MPKEGRQQEAGGYRLVLGQPRVGALERRLGDGFGMRRQRQQDFDEVALAHPLEGRKGVSVQEHLAELVEQPCRGYGRQEFAHGRDGRLGFGIEREAELRLESDRAQNAHRIFAIARFGIAN